MTDDDDEIEEDEPTEYASDESRGRPRWLLPALLFGLALVVGLIASAFLVNAHRATKAKVSTDAALTPDPIHKPLPAPMGGETTNLPPAASTAAQDAAAPPESPGPAELAQASIESQSSDTASRTPEIGAASPALAQEAGRSIGDSEPQVVSRIEPEYPDNALRAGSEGEVRLTLSIDPNGNVSDVRVASSSGSNELDRAAIDSVRAWKFAPATHNGEPVEGTVEVPLQFSLGDQR